MSMSNLQIRRAIPAESAALTALAHAAKRHWNYPDRWIAHWREELTIACDFISNNEVFVAMIDGEIGGCCALVVSESLAELEHMWIDPKQMGNGIGWALFEQVQARARDLGAPMLELSADPHAEKFYERMGAKRVGDVKADMFGQARVLPRMRVEFAVPPSASDS